MPRGPRLDAPGTLHHIMVRGIEGRRIFRDERDGDDFVRRLASLAQAGSFRVYAWTLLPNHVHLLVRTGNSPLSRAMRSLLTGYAGAFNRRHRRIGHLFQNRYKSVVVEDEPYFLELVRYLHLNVLRARVIKNLRELDRYPHSGHAAILGIHPRPWQDTREVLGRFGRNARRARSLYRAFVADGVPRGSRPELMGGGLVRSAGGWHAVRELRRGRERYLADERVLGGSQFVATLLREVEDRASTRGALRAMSLQALVHKICSSVGVPPEMLAGGGRLADVCRAREGIAYWWIECLGRNGRQLVPALGIRSASVYKAAQRGREVQAKWRRIVES